MGVREFINFLFKKEKSTPSHYSFRVFGIGIKLLKPSLKRDRKKMVSYYQTFDNPALIPQAQGNLRLIQRANTKLLSEFHQICTENNLRYWIDFGTLLGSIRHKGFIPWDDDIDLGMLRTDYERLIELFTEGLIDNPDLIIEFENNKNTKCFVKISHKKSENLFLDIFPYDYYYTNLSNEGKKTLSKKITESRKPMPFALRNSVDSIRNHFKTITNTVILEGKLPNENEKPAIFMGIDFPHRWENKVYDWEDIFPLKLIRFEDNEVFAPNMPEKILESIYGNYMEIPRNSYPRHSGYSDITEEEKSFLEEYIK